MWNALMNNDMNLTLLKDRNHLIGPNVSLSYNKPLLITRGQGQYLYDERGQRYLDCVNNIAHVGHCHPKVVAAGQQQMAVLNTNTRYLHPTLTAYAAKLIASLPSRLKVCFFVNSGSEANELALRLAMAHTQRTHFLVMDHAYHGNTSSLIQISPYKFNAKGGLGKPHHVQVQPIPDPLRDEHIPQLVSVSSQTAAFICESLLSCGGQIILPDHYLHAVYKAVREVGGVCIADEVQVGLGRVGSHFWGFETQGVVPDIVTMGKPLGNGHPIGVVVTTPEIANSFNNGMEYFNSFGGNPVSCAIGLSVLEVIEDEKLQYAALTTGDYLKQKCEALQSKHAQIGQVRGLGLFLGVELVTERQKNTPAAELAQCVVNYMKDMGVLVSCDGPYKNVLKIKPPMIFNQENCDELVCAMDKALTFFATI